MSRYLFELATPADDSDLRRILAETPMEGRIAVAFRREPSWFAGAVVDGRFRQVVACRDLMTGRVIGFGCRSVREVYVNGVPASVGYLSGLRVLPGHRNLGLIARGYARLHELHDDGQTPLYLTTIAEGNAAALNVLTCGRAGLPRYHPAGRFLTAVIPFKKMPDPALPPGLVIRPARRDDVPALLAFLRTVGPRRQFFPRYEADDFFTPDGAFRDLLPEDLLLAFKGDDVVGTLGAWDQHAFRQTVVHRYSQPLRWVRPAYNTWALLTGQPCLPRTGKALRHRTAALPLVADDDPAVFDTLLLTHLTRHAGRGGYLFVGLHEDDPLSAVLRQWRARWYTTHLFHVCWDDGEAMRRSLDGRPTYLELGSL